MQVNLAAGVDWKQMCYGDAHFRRVELPLPPFPGLVLRQVVGRPFMDEWIVTDVEVNLESNAVVVWIQLHE